MSYNEMEQLYQQVILDHSKRPHGQHGELADGPRVGESFQVNPTCGDQIKLQVRLHDQDAVLEEISWEGVGCSISQASMSILYDLVTPTKPVEEFNRLLGLFRELMHSKGQPLSEDKEDLLEDATAFTGVAKYSARVKCALLGWMALQDAIASAENQS